MTSTAAILASDFGQKVTDPNRRRWSIGHLQHVIAALAGAPVAITIHRGSGHTLIGVELVDAFEGGPARGPRVAIRSTLSDGTTQVTNYFIPEIGEAIIPLTAEGAKAKWTATKSVMDQVGVAIRTAQAEHGECEGRTWGAWKGVPMGLNVVMVSYEPLTGNPAFADQWGTPWWGRVDAKVPATV
jgi:hypothetical protein